MEGWAVTDSQARYGVFETREQALMNARMHANRNNRTMLVHYWNGPKWREEGHYVEYRESPCTQIYPEQAQ